MTCKTCSENFHDLGKNFFIMDGIVSLGMKNRPRYLRKANGHMITATLPRPIIGSTRSAEDRD